MKSGPSALEGDPCEKPESSQAPRYGLPLTGRGPRSPRSLSSRTSAAIGVRGAAERRAREGHDGARSPRPGVQRGQRPRRASASQSAAAAALASANRDAQRGARALRARRGAWPAVRVRGAGAVVRCAVGLNRAVWDPLGVCGAHSLCAGLCAHRGAERCRRVPCRLRSRSAAGWYPA